MRPVTIFDKSALQSLRMHEVLSWARVQTGAYGSCGKEPPTVDVIYSVAVSLDGFVARPDVDFDWLGPFMASGDDYVGEFIDSMGVLLVGSHTYAESEQTLEWFGQGMQR